MPTSSEGRLQVDISRPSVVERPITALRRPLINAPRATAKRAETGPSFDGDRVLRLGRQRSFAGRNRPRDDHVRLKGRSAVVRLAKIT